MNMTIAVVQFEITHQQPEINLRRIESFIARAKQQHANVIVFPEDCVTGSIFGDRSKLDSNGTYRNAFEQLAKTYAIDIVAGSFMEQTSKGAFNTSYYIDASGNSLAQYQKTNLYHSERHFLNQGSDIAVFDTAYGRAGIVICWDIMFPELFRRMMRAGVEIIYCPSYWYREITGPYSSYNPHSEEQLIDAICSARSIENNIVFVYANAAGVMKNPDGSVDTLTGHSQITLPFIGAIHKETSNTETMFVKTIDTSILQAAANTYKLKEDLEKRII